MGDVYKWYQQKPIYRRFTSPITHLNGKTKSHDLFSDDLHHPFTVDLPFTLW